jgi:hypothetical protein
LLIASTWRAEDKIRPRLHERRRRPRDDCRPGRWRDPKIQPRAFQYRASRRDPSRSSASQPSCPSSTIFVAGRTCLIPPRRWFTLPRTANRRSLPCPSSLLCPVLCTMHFCISLPLCQLSDEASIEIHSEAHPGKLGAGGRTSERYQCRRAVARFGMVPPWGETR